MIFLPPDELIEYIENDENGNWIYSQNMPKELIPCFNKFVAEIEAAEKDKLAIFNEARRSIEDV